MIARPISNATKAPAIHGRWYTRRKAPGNHVAFTPPQRNVPLDRTDPTTWKPWRT